MIKKTELIRVAVIMGKWGSGGVEAVVMNYYTHLDHSKIQYDFICDEDSTLIPKEKIEKLGGRVIICPPYQKVFKYIKFLENLFKKNKYQIVHSNLTTMSVFSLYAAKKAGVPIRICHGHNTYNIKEFKKTILKYLLKPFSKKYATNYFACSQLAGKWLFGKKTFDEGKVFLINNAIDLDYFKFNEKIRNKKRKELQINDDTLVVGHIGRFVAQKNHLFIIDIFNELHKKNPNSILLLIGEGSLLDEVKNKVDILDLKKHVMFLGVRNDISELYQIMDVFILPSLYEGLPVVGIEAQASGLPCLFSNRVTKEAKILKSTKFLDINDSLENWAESILKENIKNRINPYDDFTKKGFNIDIESKKLMDIYIELLEKKHECD